MATEPRARVCNHPDCDNAPIPCYLPSYTGNPETDAPDEWYCPTHAAENGYCASCGQFWAGVESFDMDPHGICENCRFAEPDGDDDGYDEYPEDDAYEAFLEREERSFIGLDE